MISAAARARSSAAYSLLSSTALFALGLAAIIAFHRGASPRAGMATVHREGLPPLETILPVAIKTEKSRMRVEVPLDVGRWSTRQLRVIPDDCLEGLWINDHPVTVPPEHRCDYGGGVALDLSSALHIGRNVLRADISDAGNVGGLRIVPHSLAVAPLLARVFLLILVAWYGWRIARRIASTAPQRGAAFVIIAALLVHLVYVLGTTYVTRGHDATAHLEYVQYIAEHWRLPPVDEGWEYFHPPLYYALGAVWLVGSQWLLGPLAEPAFLLQILSFVLVAGCLVLWGRIACDAFPTHPRAAALATALGAFLPSIIFVSARVNNDVLLLFLELAAVALLLRWWERGWIRGWYGFCAAIILGALTKTNGLVLFPAGIACLLLDRRSRMPTRWTRAIASTILVVGISAAMIVPRAAEHRNGPQVVGNIGAITGDMVVPNTLEAFLTFSPQGILQNVYNNPWRGARREFFLEYLFRSAFSGEFQFPDWLKPLSIAITALGLLMLAVAGFGVLRAYADRWPLTAPLVFLFASILGGHIAFRIAYPFTSSQDFRYSLLLALPVALFAAREAVSAPRWWGWTVRSAGWSLVSLCIGFILALQAA
ncbi:MAG: hypothetical protein G01um101425_882 [Candidatus Peregrinibacteria bacterium Gr01-1014_25]|nr:MAG: hypothetical protein G01um101425_882 [Candidatus Peregrinibacteria bacterium Gr01-1014_25]